MFQIAVCLLDVIIDANVSFQFAQQPSLQKLLEVIAGRKVIMPTKYKLKLTLNSQHAQVKNELIEHLSQQKNVCLTTDVWTSHAQSYIGVTIHFINDSFKRESYLLAFKQLYGCQTYDVLGNALNNIMSDFKITFSQVRNIVTDGGSNFCKMFKEYGTSASAVGFDMDEAENSVELAIEEDPEDSNAQLVIRDEDGSQFINEILNFKEPSTIAAPQSIIDDLVIQEYLGGSSSLDRTEPDCIKMPPQRRCQSHLLNLLSSDFDNELDGVPKAAYTYTIGALQTLWTTSRTSSHAREICKDILGVKLIYPNSTRWNSFMDSVVQLNKLKSQLNELIATLKIKLNSNTSKQLRALNANDFLVMAEYEKIFSPVAKSLDILQGDKINSQGWIMPVLLSMRQRVEDATTVSNIGRDFKNIMLKLIDHRFSKTLDFDLINKDFILSAISLPRFKLNFIKNNGDKTFARNMLLNECKMLADQSNIILSENLDITESVENDDFLISFAQSDNNRRLSIDNQIDIEVSQFLLDTRIENDILNEYKYIKSVFIKYNTTLSSSAPVERVFSQTSLIFTPRRNRLSADSFEKIVFLKHNKKLLEQKSIKL